jgi:hypothetical protein
LSDIDLIYDYDDWLKEQWALEAAQEKVKEANRIRTINAALTVSGYAHDRSIDRQLQQIGNVATQLTKLIDNRNAELSRITKANRQKQFIQSSQSSLHP